jgi:Ca2+-binding EF-hand superfamily protein
MGDLDLEVWNQMLLECDNNNDGLISREEFKKLLLSKT